MNEPTNIVTVQMEKDQSFTVSLNGREVQDVVWVSNLVHSEVSFGDTIHTPESQENYTGDYATLTLRVAQYNVLQPKLDADEEERLRRGKLIAAHEEGECIMFRSNIDGAKWQQANPSRDGWHWGEYEYRALA